MRWKQPKVQESGPNFRGRGYFVMAALGLCAVGLLARAVDLQVYKRNFLENEGNARFVRNVPIPAHRGPILDRFREPLAVSTPVDTVWVNPSMLASNPEQMLRLARVLNRDPAWLTRRVTSNLELQYLVLEKQLQPEDAERVRALRIPGVNLRREYRRFYPGGEVTGHVLGFTGSEDQGQEGLELAFEQVLGGEDGTKRVLQDRLGQVVDSVEIVKPPRSGEEIVTSLDLRIQYLAYRELKSAIREFQARAGSVIVLDVTTGEILAMVNQPSFNPNDRLKLDVNTYRNRAATDIFEPGSSMKPFIVATALASGKYTKTSTVDTNPGFFKVGNKTIEDHQNFGVVDLATILAKSSNVGIAHVAVTLDKAAIYNTLAGVGFGQVTPSGFPGESAGLLSHYEHWKEISVATLAYGYGLSVTPLQLAQAYATIGAFGVRRPVTFRKLDGPVAGERVLPAEACRDLVHMLESVVSADGTALRAAVRGYRVAGKTGTAWKSTIGGYSQDRFMAVFAGFVPASNPRLAAVVVIDEPSNGLHQGGQVSAPVFSGILSGALRLLAVPPDDLAHVPAATLVQAATEQ